MSHVFEAGDYCPENFQGKHRFIFAERVWLIFPIWRCMCGALTHRLKKAAASWGKN